MPFLTPKPPTLLQVSESQAISNSSSFISSSSSSLFDRTSGASSGYLTDLSSPFTPSTAEFGKEDEEALFRLSDCPTKEQASLPSSQRGQDRVLFSSQSRLSQPTNISPINLSRRLDRACTLGSRSSARSYSQNGTPFLSLIPIAVTRNEDRRYHPASDSEDTFDAVTILRDRLERENPTVATKRALEIMDSGSRPPAAGRVGGAVEAAVQVVITEPVSIEFPSKPVLEPVAWGSPCSPFILGTPHMAANWQASGSSLSTVITSGSLGSPFNLRTPDLSADLSNNWENSSSSIATLMAESPLSQISSPVNISFDEEEMAHIMRTLISYPTRTRQLFSGSPEVDVDVDMATVMRVEIASAFTGDRPHPHAGQTRTRIGLGVAMPVIYPSLPPTLFPLHHPPGATLNSRSLRELGYPTFDDRMFEIERNSLALLPRNVNESSRPENVETHNAFEVEQPLAPPHRPTDPSAFGKILVGLGLGLDGLTEASVESQPSPAEPPPTTGRHDLVPVDETINEGEVALPPVSDFYLQAQKSLNFEPLGVQKTIELDASQLERQSALYNLEHSDLLLEHIFSHSPPIHLEKKSEIERQLLANLFKKKSRPRSKTRRPVHNPSYSARDDLDLTSPTVAPQDDPRSPNPSALKRAFLSFTSLHSSSPSTKNQSSDSVPTMVEPSTHIQSEVPFKANKNTHIGLGLPSRVAFLRMLRRKEMSSQGSIEAIRCQSRYSQECQTPSLMLGRQETFSRSSIEAIRCRSRKSSQECETPTLIVTEPSFTPSYISRIQSTESSNQFLKPSHFTPRSLYDIAEVLTPPSSTSSPPCRTSSPRNQWSSLFTRLNVPQKKSSSRSQLTTSSIGSLLTVTEVGATNVEPLPEVLVTPVISVRPGFKRLVSKLTRGLFKRSRSSKTSDLSSPVLIEHADAPPVFGLLHQDNLVTSQENGLTSSISSQNLKFLF